MKKTITAIAAALLLVAFGGTTAFAGHHHGHMNLPSCHLGVSHSCVDTDGDGICDHYAECFTDQDGDGVCDYLGAAASHHTGHHGHGHGAGRCRG